MQLFRQVELIICCQVLISIDYVSSLGHSF